MVRFNNKHFFKHSDRIDIFSYSWKPGEIVEYSGIYRCKVCEQEMTAIEGDTITTEYHSHDKPIEWQLVVTTNNYDV